MKSPREKQLEKENKRLQECREYVEIDLFLSNAKLYPVAASQYMTINKMIARKKEIAICIQRTLGGK